MKDYPCFVSSSSRYMHMPGLSEAFQGLLFGWHKKFQAYIGRACVHECGYCGGSREAHTLIAGRTCVALRSVNSIVSSIRDLERFGFDSACLALDSFPLTPADDYYSAIFDELKRLNIKLDIEIERYFLPSARFIEGFRELPGKGSFITLSPHTQNADLRKKNGLYRYSNLAIENCLDLMETRNVNSLLCFTCGWPFETREDLEEMVSYQRRLRKKYSRMRFKTCMIGIEPGSGMSRMPEPYGLKLERSSFGGLLSLP